MGSHTATRLGRGLQHQGAQPGPGQIAGSGKSGDPGADDDGSTSGSGRAVMAARG